MNVLIRADASAVIGIGHVARCLTLAAELVARGARVSFACRQLPGHQMARIAEAGHTVLAVAEDDESGFLAGDEPFDWIIVDHYQLDAGWEAAARRWARRIMVIDDLADRPHDCDLLLDQNFTADSSLYLSRVPPACALLLGPHHALLRPAFRQSRAADADRSRRVLVSFGGFDQGGMSLKTLQALAGIDGVAVQCIVGQASPDLLALRSLAARHSGWQLLPFVNDLPERMASAALFVGAGGGTTWERAAMGLPSLCVSVADNQVANARALAEAGVHRYLGPAEAVTVEALRESISALLDDASLRQDLARRSRALVDGFGAQRVAGALFEQVLKDSQHEQF